MMNISARLLCQGTSRTALMLAALLLSAATIAQQRDPVAGWLYMLDDDATAGAELASLGPQAVPLLSSAARNGPESSLTSDREAQLSATYDEIQAALASGAVQAGGPADIAAAQAQSRNEFIAQNMAGFLSRYRLHGVQGLAVVRGPEALAALQAIAGDSSDQEVQSEAARIISANFSAGTIDFAATATNTAESGGSVVLTVTRSGGAGAVSVAYGTTAGTAQGGDYTSTSGTLAWADGDATSKTITIPIVNDTASESGESFTVSLSSSTGGAALGNALATITITDDDAAPTSSGGGGAIDVFLLASLFAYAVGRRRSRLKTSPRHGG